MNLFRINTTAYGEEDFIIVTDLTDEQIMKVIKPIVYAERNGGKEYDNYDLHFAITSAYPNSIVDMHSDIDNLDMITI